MLENMASRNILAKGLVGLLVTFLVILAVSSFLRPYRREGFADAPQKDPRPSGPRGPRPSGPRDTRPSGPRLCAPGKSRKPSCPGKCC